MKQEPAESALVKIKPDLRRTCLGRSGRQYTNLFCIPQGVRAFLAVPMAVPTSTCLLVVGVRSSSGRLQQPSRLNGFGLDRESRVDCKTRATFASGTGW